MTIIDIASDVASILGSDADFARTSAVWTKSDGSTTDTVSGILYEADGESLDDSVLDQLSALFIVATTQFTNVTVRSPGDTLTIAGQATWTVRVVRERLFHVFVRMVKDVQKGRDN